MENIQVHLGMVKWNFAFDSIMLGNMFNFTAGPSSHMQVFYPGVFLNKWHFSTM